MTAVNNTVGYSQQCHILILVTGEQRGQCEQTTDGGEENVLH